MTPGIIGKINSSDQWYSTIITETKDTVKVSVLHKVQKRMYINGVGFGFLKALLKYTPHVIESKHFKCIIRWLLALPDMCSHPNFSTDQNETQLNSMGHTHKQP